MRKGMIISLSKKKSKREEMTVAEAKEVSKLTFKEGLLREDVDCKSHVQDSSSSTLVKNGSCLFGREVPYVKSRGEQVCKSFAANKKSSLGENDLNTAEAKEREDEKLGDIFALDKSLDNEMVGRGSTVELGSEKVNVCPKAKQDSYKDQAKPTQEHGRVLPKFGEWDVNDPASTEGFTVIFNNARDEKKRGVRGDLSDDFHKIKTFDIRGVTSGGKERKTFNWSRLKW